MAGAFATEDAGYIAHVFRSLSENGNSKLKTTIAVMKALGIEITAKAHP